MIMAFYIWFSVTLSAIALITAITFHFLFTFPRTIETTLGWIFSVRLRSPTSKWLSKDWRSTFKPSTAPVKILSGVLLILSHLIAVFAFLPQPLHAAIGARAAEAAVVSLPLLLMSSTHKNFLALLSGRSHLEMTFMHSCLGYVVVIESVLHVALHLPGKFWQS